MMLFSLVLEIFPDGVYRTISTTVANNDVTIVYDFTGTRVFEQTLDILYKQCRVHAMNPSGPWTGIGIADGNTNKRMGAAGYETTVIEDPYEGMFAVSLFTNSTVFCPENFIKGTSCHICRLFVY